ncbi:MAG: hypothetical protein ABR583_01545 [Gaiellaceae bacterium]
MARVNAQQARQARQKKMIIGGAVLLAIVLVIQVPRTMKMLSGSSTPASAAPTPAAVPTPIVPAATATPSAPPAVEAGKLASLDRFSSKDPFAEQISASVASAPAAEPAAQADEGGNEAAPAGSTQPTAFQIGSASKPGKSAATSGAQTASLTVNGKQERVTLSKLFPAADPVFKLLSVGEDTAEISIAGGSFKDGGKTITLTVGKAVTLMNTASGKRYVIQLASTSV